MDPAFEIGVLALEAGYAREWLEKLGAVPEIWMAVGNNLPVDESKRESATLQHTIPIKSATALSGCCLDSGQGWSLGLAVVIGERAHHGQWDSSLPVVFIGYELEGDALDIFQSSNSPRKAATSLLRAVESETSRPASIVRYDDSKGRTHKFICCFADLEPTFQKRSTLFLVKTSGELERKFSPNAMVRNNVIRALISEERSYAIMDKPPTSSTSTLTHIPNLSNTRHPRALEAQRHTVRKDHVHSPAPQAYT
ncbi:hypothetical protein CPB84DRAFT_1847786 [Gymnopilus junonius]|uniref:Uncharacterized protein n=1 Tax=Gymnopilus junonius TaxID=109634 RepID=A0A9P5NLK6_GYMJU|nr:hypothetical protein CPB84DRAFT_1847786 [Gymnopilus junonius]